MIDRFPHGNYDDLETPAVTDSDDALQTAKNQLAAAMTVPLPHDYPDEATHYAIVSLASVGIAIVERLDRIAVIFEKVENQDMLRVEES